MLTLYVADIQTVQPATLSLNGPTHSRQKDTFTSGNQRKKELKTSMSVQHG